MLIVARYLRIIARGQLRYRSTFYMNLFGQIALPLSVLAGVWFLFARFGSLGGWTAAEALLCYGVANSAFALSELLARGFDAFPTVLADGEFDRILVRPRSLVAQVLGSRLELSRFGRLSVGLLVLAWAIRGAGIEWNPLKAASLALMVICGAALFTGVFILGAAFAFVTKDALELLNVFSDGGRELAQYPISIYGRPFRLIFTFVVPFACVNYLPLLYVLGKPGGMPAYACLPLAGIAFMFPCLLAWRAGVRRYTSTGS